MDLSRNGFVMHISEEMALDNSWFPKKGHLEEIPLTDEDRATHARAVLAYEEVMSNPWVRVDGYEFDFAVEPLEPRQTFVAEETDAEHMARWVAAGRPMHNPIQDMMRANLDAMSRALDSEIINGYRDKEQGT